MNPWYVQMIELLVLAALFIGFIILLVKKIKAKKQNKPTGKVSFMLSLDTLLFIGSFVFVLSHSTYYKYNDWIIVNSDINSVVSKYGAFDKGTVEEGRSGKIGYYIYNDDGPIMPDHTAHYYWIYFNESGAVCKVEDNLLPGG